MTENLSLIKVLKNHNSYIQVCTIYINILTNLRIVKNVYQYRSLTSGAGKFLGIPGKKLGKSWEFFPGICWDS